LGTPALAARRQTNLNRQFAGAIGIKSDALTGPVLGQASNRIGRVFEDAADAVDIIPITQRFSDRLGALEIDAANLLPNARALKQLERVQDITIGDKMTGKQYLRLRSEIGKISRAEWNPGGDQVSAEFLDDLLTGLDDMFAESSPALAEALGPARQQWRILSAMRKGASLDPRGNVNPNAMQNALEKSFRTLDRGNFAEGFIGGAQRANRAAQQFPPEASSRTAERLVSLNPLRLVQAALLNVGGGAGAAAGGNIARQIGVGLTTPTENQ